MDQLQRYLEHISSPAIHNTQLPESKPLFFLPDFQSSPMENLTTLMRHQLSTVSFDSLALHYSLHHSVSLWPDALFEKLIVSGENGQGNRGGYCMENNSFFGTVLRSLRYDVLTCGERVLTPRMGLPVAGFWDGTFP
jgi:arylamine N-acetyltransferase